VFSFSRSSPLLLYFAPWPEQLLEQKKAWPKEHFGFCPLDQFC
jgi:hypothetical protein